VAILYNRARLGRHKAAIVFPCYYKTWISIFNRFICLNSEKILIVVVTAGLMQRSEMRRVQGSRCILKY
jgi:hypothetical protein